MPLRPNTSTTIALLGKVGQRSLCQAAHLEWLIESSFHSSFANWLAVCRKSFPVAAPLRHKGAPRSSWPAQFQSDMLDFKLCCFGTQAPGGAMAEPSHGQAGASASSTAAQVRVLVEEGGASFDARDEYCMDPLDEAMRHRHEDVVALLQSRGALIGGRDPL